MPKVLSGSLKWIFLLFAILNVNAQVVDGKIKAESKENSINSAPWLTSIEPNQAARSEKLSVRITGSQTVFQSGSMTTDRVWFSQGTSTIEGTNITVFNDTELSSWFEIPADASTGLWDVNVNQSDGWVVTLDDGFTITLSANPRLVAVIPDHAHQGQTLAVEMVGVNADFIQGSFTTNNAWFSQGSSTIYSTSLTPLSDTRLKATFTIPGTAGLGYWDANVRQGDGLEMSLANGFLVEAGQTIPIISVAPDSAFLGDRLSVTITGQNTHFSEGSEVTNQIWFSQGSSTISATNVRVYSTEWALADFSIPLTATPGWWDVSVQQVGNWGVVTLENGFEIISLPEARLISIKPNHARQGQNLSVTITGENTNFKLGSATTEKVWFSQGTATINASYHLATNENTIEAWVQINPSIPFGYWDVKVTQPEKNRTLTLEDGFIITSRVNHPPEPFSLLAPADGSLVASLTPVLSWAPAVDVDPLDTLRYTITLDTPEVGVQTIFADTATSFQISTPLRDNAIYHWKVTVQDQHGASVDNINGYQTFRIDLTNEPPHSFRLITPTDSSVEIDLTPIFVWENQGDPDGDSLTYKLFYGQDPSFTATTPILLHKHEYVAEKALLDNSTYYWTVIAEDARGMQTTTQKFLFWTNVALEPPNDFQLLSPENGSITASQTPQFKWQQATDNDPGDYAVYTLVLATDSLFRNTILTAEMLDDTSFTVTNVLQKRQMYYWKVMAMDTDSLITESAVFNFTVESESGFDASDLVSTSYALHQNYPNPFNSSTAIHFSLPEEGYVELKVYNVGGQEMATLISSTRKAGNYITTWHAENAPSGIYFYKLKTEAFEKICKMTLLK